MISTLLDLINVILNKKNVLDSMLLKSALKVLSSEMDPAEIRLIR